MNTNHKLTESDKQSKLKNEIFILLKNNPSGLSEKEIIDKLSQKSILVHDCLYKNKNKLFSLKEDLCLWCLSEFYENKKKQTPKPIKKPENKPIYKDYTKAGLLRCILRTLRNEPIGMHEQDICHTLKAKPIAVHDCLYKNLKKYFSVSSDGSLWTLSETYRNHFLKEKEKEKETYPYEEGLFRVHDFYDRLNYSPSEDRIEDLNLPEAAQLYVDDVYEDLVRAFEDHLNTNEYITVDYLVDEVVFSQLPRKKYYRELVTLAVNINKEIYRRKNFIYYYDE